MTGCTAALQFSACRLLGSLEVRAPVAGLGGILAGLSKWLAQNSVFCCNEREFEVLYVQQVCVSMANAVRVHTSCWQYQRSSHLRFDFRTETEEGKSTEIFPLNLSWGTHRGCGTAL
jgi:hypothetical protein